MCGFVLCLVLLSSGVSDKKLLRSCEEISSSSSCVGEEDHSPALNGHDIQSLAITAQALERVRESVCVCVCVFTPHSHRCYSWMCFRIFCVVELYHVSLLLSSQLRVPKPPSDSQKPKSMTRVYVRKTRPPDEVSRVVRVTVARPLPLDVAPPHPFEYSGSGRGLWSAHYVQCD